MLSAAIDVGSNTVRMLIGHPSDRGIQDPRYARCITRLAGDFSPRNELSPKSMERTLSALRLFHAQLEQQAVRRVRAVGTAALRRALNCNEFIRQVKTATGLKIDVISGEEEARLMTSGVLSVIHPRPEAAILIDIGGGSTELVCVVDDKVVFQHSYPLGVVQLCEEFSGDSQRRTYIQKVVNEFAACLNDFAPLPQTVQLIGTAGTITTLAAIHQGLIHYQPELVNNYQLSKGWIEKLYVKLDRMSHIEREQVRGMEPGRGDLILPGMLIVLALLEKLDLATLKISDSGLLEGVLLDQYSAVS
ncbi:MAG: Ppx/GppA family phosphatase [Desulfuromonadales bacterium]|nr:Ppx/GppA family phosphatase [Desulfuromonadales bacterium]MBN2793187.1 Ppx/GppA family phosphatase [Desulfuromonadales bacterium]